MENGLVCICGVRCYEKDGVAYLHIEDVARGLGFTQIATSGNECVRWERVERFLGELKFIPTCGDDGNPHDYYIPENIFYRLCMKARNEVAEAFQAKVADEIIPSIRKTGKYEAHPTVPSYMLKSEEERALAWAEEHRQARLALEAKDREIEALEVERDEAIRTKHHFVEGRDAKVCGELGGLRTQNEALRKQIGDAKKYKAVTAISWLPDYFDISNRGLYGSLASKLKKLEAEMPREFAHTDIPDSRYGTVKAYHVKVIERLHEMVQADETLMAKYRKIASV